MTPITYFSEIWKRLYRIGADELESTENKTIKLLNQAALLTSSGSLVTAFVSYTFSDGTSNVYVYFPCIIFLLYAIIPIAHYFKKSYFVKLYITFLLPLWIYISIILVNSFFSQSIATVATIILGYFFFKKTPKLQSFSVIYNCFMYISATSIAAYSTPFIAAPDIPFDEACVFLISLSWIKVIFSVHEYEKDTLIKSLQQNNTALKNTTEELERFTHIASHDLKSPLRTIISFLDLMKRDINKKQYDQLEQNLAFAKSGAQQLNYLIRDVLEISKVNVQAEKEKVMIDLKQTLKKVKLNIDAELEEKNAVIIAEDLPSYYCNEVEFILLFQNLIQNGIKYNQSSHPTINIWSESSETELKLFFKDNGIGIEDTYFDHIFEYFKRLHSSSEYMGTGLGLSLCKKVIISYEGTISIESKVGAGSTFIISLPIVTDHANEVAQSKVELAMHGS